MNRSHTIASVAVALVGILVLVAVARANGKPPGHPSFEPPEEQKTLWNEHVRERPNPRILDDFELCEDIVLLSALKKVRPRTAALATVAFHQAGPDVALFSLTDRKVLEYATEMNDGPAGKKKLQKLRGLPDRAAKLYGKQAAAPHYVTYNLGHALLLQRTMEGADTIQQCLKRIARRNGWKATVEKSADCGFERYRESIDKSVPVLLTTGKRGGELRYRICFGYLQADGRNYLAVARPEQTSLQKGRPVSMTDKERAGRLTSEWTWRAIERRRSVLEDMPWDIQMNTDKPLLRGMSLEEFQKGRYTAYFIYNWRPSAAAWREEIIEIVGEPEDETDKEEE